MDGLTATSEDSDRSTISPRDLERHCTAILLSVGAGEQVATIVAASMVLAEARGQSSHGVARLATYVKRIQNGLIQPNAEPTIVHETGAVAVLDANAGFGHVAGLRAMELCVDKAHQFGVGVVSVRNSTHFGIASIFADHASARRCIGIATSNAAPRMAPPGACTPVLGTNPLAVAIPGSSGSAFTLDMATSVAALGKILAARDAGHSIPEGWALTADGATTTDAAVAASDGLILPLGGPKGFGLALVLEVLSAVLSGASAGQHAGSMYRTWNRPEDLGHFFLALSTVAFRPGQAYEESLDDLCSQVHSAQPIRAGDRTLLPGELEADRERDTRTRGIPLNRTLRMALENAAMAAGMDLPL